jgi:hypothetical protein
MRRPGGYAMVVSPVASLVKFDGNRFECVDGTFETDSFTCIHCNRVVHVKAGSQGDEYFCRRCMAPICSPCADHPCIPFMKKIEEQEARDRQLRALRG